MLRFRRDPTQSRTLPPIPVGRRILAATLLVLWCLPVAFAILGFSLDARAGQPSLASVLASDPAFSSQTAHTAICHCLHCSGHDVGADGKTAKCCCGGVHSAAEGLIIRASCDEGTPSAAAAVLTEYKVAPSSSPLIAIPLPDVSPALLSRYARPADVAASSRSCPPPDQPPRFLA